MKIYAPYLCLLSFFPPFFVYAETLAFSGSIYQKTCAISLNGSVSGLVVLLPKIEMAKLSSEGKTTGDTEFSIEMKGCNSKEKKKRATVVAEMIVSQEDIPNLAGTANNIDVLVSGKNTGGKNVSKSKWYSTKLKPDAEGGVSIPFIVKYYAKGKAATGSVVTSTHFLIAYN